MREPGRDKALDEMKISAKAEYACLAVLALARRGPDSSALHIREISQECGIPERYLVQILLQLKGAGLVASTRGAGGGYRLARPAFHDLAFRDPGRDGRPRRRASRAIDDERAGCFRSAPVWASVRAAERVVLDQTTIGELAAQSSPHEWII